MRRVDAFVDRVLVADNQRVRAGEVLIRLDPRGYRAAFDHAPAMLQARIAAAASVVPLLRNVAPAAAPSGNTTH